MGKGKPRGLNSARKLRVHRRNKYVDYFKIKKNYQPPIVISF
ncbi:YGR118Wp-like protein [Saccharomyces cerevisiae AWRI1631]|uniref:YGR118Wp-like protein n=1 Tax=Saccharomyces cerevisiae (strain AWRI1631) TaxID=545124 RepID=B5VJ64_YEAS6|nr:YGR118Wp-like protein [Saccharomyces cerevisiae AWRI1631]